MGRFSVYLGKVTYFWKGWEPIEFITFICYVVLSMSKYIYFVQKWTIDGSSLFQVMIFTPHSMHIKASPRLCLCEQCKVKFGSCERFQQYELRVQSKKISTLRSDHLEEGQLLENSEGSDVITEYLVEGSICTVAASKASTNQIWFIKINTQRQAKEDIRDDYGNLVKGGNNYYSGNFLESQGEKVWTNGEKHFFLRGECRLSIRFF